MVSKEPSHLLTGQTNGKSTLADKLPGTMTVRSVLLNRDSPDIESRLKKRRNRTHQVRFKDLEDGSSSSGNSGTGENNSHQRPTTDCDSPHPLRKHGSRTPLPWANEPHISSLPGQTSVVGAVRGDMASTIEVVAAFLARAPPHPLTPGPTRRCWTPPQANSLTLPMTRKTSTAIQTSPCLKKPLSTHTRSHSLGDSVGIDGDDEHDSQDEYFVHNHMSAHRPKDLNGPNGCAERTAMERRSKLRTEMKSAVTVVKNSRHSCLPSVSHTEPCHCSSVVSRECPKRQGSSTPSVSRRRKRLSRTTSDPGKEVHYCTTPTQTESHSLSPAHSSTKLCTTQVQTESPSSYLDPDTKYFTTQSQTESHTQSSPVTDKACTKTKTTVTNCHPALPPDTKLSATQTPTKSSSCHTPATPLNEPCTTQPQTKSQCASPAVTTSVNTMQIQSESLDSPFKKDQDPHPTQTTVPYCTTLLPPCLPTQISQHSANPACSSAGKSTCTISTQMPLSSPCYTVTPVVTPPAVAPVVTPPAVAPVVTPPAVAPVVTPPAVAPVVTPPAVAAVVTPPAVAPVVTPPAVAPVVTPPAIAPVVTPPAVAPVVTPPAVAPVVTPPAVAPVVTPPAVAAVVTPPAVAPVVTPPAVAPVVTPPAIAPVVTPPAVAPVVTPPAVAPVVTPPAVAPVVTPPAVAPVVTPPAVAPVVTPHSEPNCTVVSPPTTPDIAVTLPVSSCNTSLSNIVPSPSLTCVSPIPKPTTVVTPNVTFTDTTRHLPTPVNVIPLLPNATSSTNVTPCTFVTQTAISCTSISYYTTTHPVGPTGPHPHILPPAYATLVQTVSHCNIPCQVLQNTVSTKITPYSSPVPKLKSCTSPPILVKTYRSNLPVVQQCVTPTKTAPLYSSTFRAAPPYTPPCQTQDKRGIRLPPPPPPPPPPYTPRKNTNDQPATQTSMLRTDNKTTEKDNGSKDKKEDIKCKESPKLSGRASSLKHRAQTPPVAVMKGGGSPAKACFKPSCLSTAQAQLGVLHKMLCSGASTRPSTPNSQFSLPLSQQGCSGTRRCSVPADRPIAGPLTPAQADTLRQVQEILGGLMSGAKCKLDPSKVTEKLLSPNGPLRDIRSLQTQLQSLEGVLETSQNTIKVLLDVIQDLEKKEAVRDGRHLYRTGQDIENCGTCRDCACIIYSVEHDFRLQEGQVVRTWKVGDPPECRPQTPTPPPATPHQQDSPQAVRPPVSAKKNRKKCFWFL